MKKQLLTIFLTCAVFVFVGITAKALTSHAQAATGPQFSLVGTPVLASVRTTDPNGNIITVYAANFNIQANSADNLYMGLPSSAKSAFPLATESWTIFKNGVAVDTLSDYNAMVSFSAPSAASSSPDGAYFKIAANQQAIIPVTLSFMAQNNGSDVYGVELNGLYWSSFPNGAQNYWSASGWKVTGSAKLPISLPASRPPLVSSSSLATTSTATSTLASAALAASCYRFTRDLWIGETMSADESNALSTLLKNQGLLASNSTLNNPYDGVAESAVVLLQAKYNIPNTGYFGPLTRAQVNSMNWCANSLSSASATANGSSQALSGRSSQIPASLLSLTYHSTGADVVSLQNNLISRGYLDPSDSTGYYGPITENALSKYLNSANHSSVSMPSQTPIPTATPLSTNVPTPSQIHNSLPTQAQFQAASPSPTNVPVSSPNYSPSPTPIYSSTPTPSPTQTPAYSPSPTPSPTVTSSPTPSPTPASTVTPSPSPSPSSSPKPSTSPNPSPSPSPVSVSGQDSVNDALIWAAVEEYCAVNHCQRFSQQ